MNTSESADELVKICIDGVDRILRISGVAAKNIALMLIAMSKEKTQTSGKTRLTNMLRSGKNLDIFTIKASDLKKFSQEAKKYGILYCALANKKNNKIDGMVDIMVREEDGAKIDRISKRFNFKDVTTIRQELDKEKAEINETAKSEDEQFLDDILPKDKEEQKEIPSNNTNETEEKSQSEISLDTKLRDKMEKFKSEKKSVKKELKEIEEELKQISELQNEPIDNTKENNKEKQAKRYKEKEQKQHKKEKHRAKRYKEPRHLDIQKSKKTKYNKGRSR